MQCGCRGGCRSGDCCGNHRLIFTTAKSTDFAIQKIATSAFLISASSHFSSKSGRSTVQTNSTDHHLKAKKVVQRFVRCNLLMGHQQVLPGLAAHGSDVVCRVLAPQRARVRFGLHLRALHFFAGLGFHHQHMVRRFGHKVGHVFGLLRPQLVEHLKLAFGRFEPLVGIAL